MDSSRKNFFIKWLLLFLAIFLLLVLSALSAYVIFENRYKNKFYPGISIAGLDVSGLSIEEAKKILNKKADKINEKGIDFHYHDKTITLYPLIGSLEGDLAYELITFNINDTVKEVFKKSRQGNFGNALKTKLNAYFNKTNYRLFVAINSNEIYKFLKNNFASHERPAENAKLIYEPTTDYEPANFYITEEKYGQTIEYGQAIKKLNENLKSLDSGLIELTASMDYPLVKKEDISDLEANIRSLLEKTPFYLVYKNEKWVINEKQMAKWLVLKKIYSAAGNNYIGVGIGTEEFFSYLENEIVQEINVAPINAKFEINEGKVTEFRQSQNGITVDAKKTYLKLEEWLLNKASGTAREIGLVVQETKSDIKTEAINDLGIKEIIGTGHSSFAGSPNNRRHNIAVGASAVNGTLIKPGEEFSLVAALGEINKDTGYLPELVIKDNKTIPEYGGGLCQIGTTLFRATLASGLPVTMRRNHSYRVSYYEPAGTDATIYNPWPDYKFLNDTPYHILIQSRVEKDDLYFDFWSSEDGRIASTTYPRIYNIVRPGPTKIIETLDLSPGEKKCTEHAHNGADASFEYTVEYPGGEIKEKTFYSHYVPWREVCLLGVAELSSQNSKTSTSTAAVQP